MYAFRKSKVIAIYGSYVLLVVLVLANVSGWNPNFYVSAGQTAYGVTVSGGVINLSWSRGHYAIDSQTALFGFFHITTGEYSVIPMVDLGPLEVFLEARLEPMRWLHFGIGAQTDYVFLELPLIVGALFVTMTGFLLGIWSNKAVDRTDTATALTRSKP